MTTNSELEAAAELKSQLLIPTPESERAMTTYADGSEPRVGDVVRGDSEWPEMTVIAVREDTVDVFLPGNIPAIGFLLGRLTLVRRAEQEQLTKGPTDDQ